jgi:hypothetical protein
MERRMIVGVGLTLAFLSGCQTKVAPVPAESPKIVDEADPSGETKLRNTEQLVPVTAAPQAPSDSGSRPKPNPKKKPGTF